MPRKTREEMIELSKLAKAKREQMKLDYKAIHAKGVETKARQKKERQLFKQTINDLLSKSIRKGELVIADDVLSMAELDGKNLDVQTAILIAVVQRAMMGDMTAVQFLRDTVGEKPSDKVELDSSISIEAWAKKHKLKL